jgi:hypothetical protein
MPRRKTNIITVEPWPELRPGQLYEARIRNAVPDKAAGFLQVTAENLDPSQSGRIHETSVPLPVRPGNRACAFVGACGIDATVVGTSVDLDLIINAVIGMRFRGLDANGAEAFDFERVPTAPAEGVDTLATTEKEVLPAKQD